MKTIVEFYDPEPIYNVLAAVALRAQTMVFLGSSELNETEVRRRIEGFLKKADVTSDIRFFPVDAARPEQFEKTLDEITARFEDCAFDITGGDSRSLFVAGVYCARHNIPVIAFDEETRCFSGVYNCPRSPLPEHPVKLTVKQAVALAGGAFLRYGHIGTPDINDEMLRDIDAMWRIFADFSRYWPGFTTYIQTVVRDNSEDELTVRAPLYLKHTSEKEIAVRPDILRRLNKAGILTSLSLTDRTAEFTFKSELLKRCLSDVGIWLEMHTYRTAHFCGGFDDVQISVVIDWNGDANEKNNTINELDVVVTRGVTSLFISCKTGIPSTTALNEIGLLARRFGGKFSRGVLVTMCRLAKAAPATLRRAQEMGIEVIDYDALTKGRLNERLWALAGIPESERVYPPKKAETP